MKTLPLFICRQPLAWAAVSVCIERITHRSSANCAVQGKRLLISSPLCPCLRNSNGDCIKCPIGRPFEPTLASPEYGWPCHCVSAGLGSNVSTWLGAPFMNRKTACLALAGKCGGLGASGCSSNEPRALAAFAEKKPVRLSRSTNASPAKPPPTCQRNSRRVWPQGVELGMKREVFMVFGRESRFIMFIEG